MAAMELSFCNKSLPLIGKKIKESSYFNEFLEDHSLTNLSYQNALVILFYFKKLIYAPNKNTKFFLLQDIVYTFCIL